MVAAVVISGVKGSGLMAKAMSIAGLIVGGLITLAFLMDLVLHVPFGGVKPMMDISFAVCGGILAYLGWNALSEAK
jgi:hypothetical protein